MKHRTVVRRRWSTAVMKRRRFIASQCDTDAVHSGPYVSATRTALISHESDPPPRARARVVILDLLKPVNL